MVFISDLDKVRRDLYWPRVRPTARTGLLLLKYLKTTYRLETREGPGAARQRETGGWEGKGRFTTTITTMIITRHYGLGMT